MGRGVGGGDVQTKKVHARENEVKKNSCPPINPKKYSCYSLKKIHARNLITKKNSCGSKIALPQKPFLMVRFWNGNLRGADAFFTSFFTRWENINFVGGWNKSRNSVQCRRTLRGRKLVYVCIVVTVIFAAPRRILEWGILEEVCCDWLNAFKKSV